MDVELPLQMANRVQQLRELRDGLKVKYEQSIADVNQAERDLREMLRRYPNTAVSTTASMSQN